MGTIVLMIVPYFIGVFIMLKVGVVGVGGISGAHIPAWEEIKEVELVALCDIRQERLDQYPAKRHYNDFKEMLEKEELDILFIHHPTIPAPFWVTAESSHCTRKKFTIFFCVKNIFK